MSTYSNWREDLIEVIDTPTTEKKAEKKVKESKVNNKVVINPTFKESVAAMGGEILEVAEVDDKKGTEEDPQIKSKQKRQGMLKRQVLLKKLQAVRSGGGADITAGYEPEGELIEGKKKGLDGKECWDGYKLAGTKKKGGKTVDNCVKVDEGIKGEDNETRKAAALERKAGKKTRLSPSAGKANVAKMLWDIRNAKSNPQNESAVLDANTKIKNKEDRKKKEKEYARLISILAHQKDLKKRGLGEEIVTERLGGKGYSKQAAASSVYPGKKGTGDWEDSDRGAGNKAARRAGKKVEKKSPTYRAHVLNKEEVVDEGVMKFVKSIGRKKKPVKKATMDPTTDKLHDWRQKNSKEQQDREKYVSPFRPIVKEADDKAYNYVVSKLKKKYGDGVLTKGDKIKPPTPEQKKAKAAHDAKIAKERAAEFKKDPSQGRYPPGYSNRGSD